MLEPAVAKQRVGVKAARVGRQVLGDFAVDKHQRVVHAHRRAVLVEHRRVLAVDGHAGANGRLGQIDRGNGALAAGAANHGFQRLGQVFAQLALELAAADGVGSGIALAADQHDAGGQGVVTTCNLPCFHLCTDGPGAGEGETSAQYRFQKRLPAGAVGGVALGGVALLEGVVNSDREGRVRLRGQVVHGGRHAVQKKHLCLFLAAVAVGRSHQLLGLGHSQRGVELGENGTQAAAHPDIKEVGQISVANVVVIRRVGGDDFVGADGLCLRISLQSLPLTFRW